MKNNLLLFISSLVVGAVILVATIGAMPVNARRQNPELSPPAEATVLVGQMKFEPHVVTVKAGGTVTWENRDGAHNVVADNKSFTSPTMGEGDKFTHQFTKPGRYPYYCSFHGSRGGHDMSGVVIVVPETRASK
jgi:plastocyanin